LFGYKGEQETQSEAKQLEWNVSGTAGTYKDFATEKAKQAALPKVSFQEPFKEGEQ